MKYSNRQKRLQSKNNVDNKLTRHSEFTHESNTVDIFKVSEGSSVHCIINHFSATFDRKGHKSNGFGRVEVKAARPVWVGRKSGDVYRSCSTRPQPITWNKGTTQWAFVCLIATDYKPNLDKGVLL